jgi:hypothetical protein
VSKALLNDISLKASTSQLPHPAVTLTALGISAAPAQHSWWSTAKRACSYLTAGAGRMCMAAL